MIALRKLQTDDAQNMAELLNNKHIWDVMRDALPYPYTEADALNFIALSHKEQQMLNLAITYQHRFCGIIGIKRETDIHRKSVELGYWIGEAFWQKGIATKAVGLMTDLVFEQQAVNRIFARVFSNNPASMKVLLKNNYLLEGVFRKAVYKNGHFLDEYIYAKLR